MFLSFEIAGVVFLIIFLGIFKIIFKTLSYKKRIAFTIEYFKHYQKFVSSLCSRSQFDNEEYYWLTYNIGKIQNELGDNGILWSYQPPFANYIHKRYQIIINTLPEIKSGIAHEAMIQACEDAMVRHLGQLENALNEMKKQILNPLIWLREGINFIVTLPIYLVYWSGLMKYSALEVITESYIIKFISFLIGIIGLTGSIMTIILGWNPFLQLVKKTFGY